MLKSQSYSGSNGYKYVEHLIKNSKSIDIITPYLGIYYAKMLADFSGKGKRIRVIIAEGQNANLDAIRYLKRKVRSNIRYAVISAVSFLLFAALYLYKLPYESIVFLAIFALTAVLASRKRPNKGSINVRYSPGFVHEKIYVGDRKAITGSANLTYSGMHKNTEYLEIISDAGKADALEKHFNTLWNSSRNI
ncbi:MAG: phospholipase D family protein [Candidatus Micrarchaeaceae archaeon]